MSVGPTGVPGSVAGSPLAQTRGSDVDRTAQESDSQTRRAQGTRRAEKAAGIGQTQQDHEASDRDADGRRPWEINGQQTADDSETDSGSSAPPESPPQSRDATGQRGNRLDLSG